MVMSAAAEATGNGTGGAVLLAVVLWLLFRKKGPPRR